MTMKAHTYYIIFRRPPIGGGSFPLPPGGATGCFLENLNMLGHCVDRGRSLMSMIVVI